ncbi:MAG: GGDEF domain-containing protein, partial [Massilia sp.]
TLVRVAGALAALLHRPLDLIARYGGEEFAVILPEMDRAESLAMAENMRRRITDLRIEHVCASVAKHITVSIGVATQCSEHPAEVPALIGAADRALYTAKRTGRDRVEMQAL